MKKEYEFKVFEDKNTFEFLLSEINESNIQLIEIDLSYIGTENIFSNCIFLNKKYNLIRFMEQTYPLDISPNTNYKLQLMILFPDNIEENSYIIEGELYIKNINKYCEGFTIVIDIVKKLENNKDKVQMNKRMMENIFETIKFYNEMNKDKNNIKNRIDKEENISLIQSPPRKEITIAKSESVSIQCQRLFDKDKIEKKELVIEGNNKSNDLSIRKKSYSIHSYSFEISRCFKEKSIYEIVNLQSITINSNNQNQKEVSATQNNVNNKIENSYEQLLQENKNLKNQFRKLKQDNINKKKRIIPSQEYTFSIIKTNMHQKNQKETEKKTHLNQSQSTLMSIFRDSFEINPKNIDIDNNKIDNIEINKTKSRQLTQEEIEALILDLDTKYMTNSIFSRDDIIDAINKAKGEINKIDKLLFV